MKKYNNFVGCSTVNQSLLNKYYSAYWNVTFYLKHVLPKYLYMLLIDAWEVEITTSRQSCVLLLQYLKNHSLLLLDYLIDIIVVDTPGKKLRFQIIYLLCSVKFNTRFRVRIFTNELIPVQSITSIYKFANWAEREIWDMFGILIMDHPDLRRLLTDYGFKGFPLRKDFPLTGFYEIIYDDITKKLIETPVSLAQEYRFFEFNNPWKK
jgi:NADH:ubiquinone oxidoreductase subunit C